MSDIYAECERFLKREAHLLDEQRYQEWLDLYDKDAWYWVPIDPQAEDRRYASAHINDDYLLMQVRVERLEQETAYTEHPPSRGVRIANLVDIESSQRETEEFISLSKLLLYDYRVRQFRDNDQSTFGATVRHGLRRTEDGLRIAWKRVDLVQAEAALTAMGRPF